jgi:tRNA threonylcarbamoyladenosine biosynthesis protein TsaB
MAGCPESRRLNLLAFDTSTDILRVAVQRGAAAAPSYEGPGGAQASARLIPVIQQLLAEAGLAIGQLDAIVFGRGPGSFTGIRTACSVAQGLAFGSGVPVLAVDTLLAIAEDARHLDGCTQVVAVLDARMDEVYFAAYAYEHSAWRQQEGPALVAPQAVPVPPGWALAGNAVQVYADRLPAAAARVPAAPTAAALLRLAPRLLADGRAVNAADAMPLYIRDKVAQTTEERAVARAIKESKP